MSSDSDDDGYSKNYALKRKTKIADENRKRLNIKKTSRNKKEPEGKNVDSDDSDEIEITKTFKRKNRSLEVVEGESDDDEFSGSKKPKQSHDEYLKRRMEKEEKKYMEQLEEDMEISTNLRQNNFRHLKANDQLDSAYRMINEMTADTSGRFNDDDDIKEVDPTTSDTSYCFPVTIEVIDIQTLTSGNKFEVELMSNFEGVRENFANSWKCSTSEVILQYNGRIMTDFDTPKIMGFTPFQIPPPKLEALKKQAVTLKQRQNSNTSVVSAVKENNSDEIEIKLQIADIRKPVLIRISKMASFGSLRQMFCDAIREADGNVVIEKEKLRITCDSDTLGDGENCYEVGIEDGDCIDLYH